MVAEDDPDNQTVLLYHLCRMGLDVEVVENGRLDVEKALRGTFDLVLMDMQMPELDGYGATSSLRRSGFQAPIIALTAHAMLEDREKCLRAGCTDFLTKPVEVGLLAEVLSKHLGSREATTQANGPGEMIRCAAVRRSVARS
jgi:CheY-like chemotaxis protein